MGGECFSPKDVIPHRLLTIGSQLRRREYGDAAKTIELLCNLHRTFPTSFRIDQAEELERYKQQLDSPQSDPVNTPADLHDDEFDEELDDDDGEDDLDDDDGEDDLDDDDEERFRSAGPTGPLGLDDRGPEHFEAEDYSEDECWEDGEGEDDWDEGFDDEDEYDS